jgi:hypothetical protein
MWSFRDLFKRKQEKRETEELEIPEVILKRPPYCHSNHLENCLKDSFEEICKPKYGKDSYEK